MGIGLGGLPDSVLWDSILGHELRFMLVPHGYESVIHECGQLVDMK